MEKELYHAASSIPLPPSAPLPPSGEDWEAEAAVASYDAAAAAGRKDVVRLLRGATRSQQRKFRKEEAARLVLLRARKQEEEQGEAEAPRPLLLGESEAS